MFKCQFNYSGLSPEIEINAMKDWYKKPCPPPCEHSKKAAYARQNQLTKPTGSLGKLEEIAIQFAGWQATEKPQLNTILIRVFAADHGICAQKISAFPQEVTAQMVSNFIHGGAAISVLSEQENADFAVVNMGLAKPLVNEQNLLSDPKFINTPIAAGTQDFSQQTAMQESQVHQALQNGRNTIESQLQSSPQLFIGGEMGIGNTSSASAIYCVLLGIHPTVAVGPGTGLTTSEIERKAQIIQAALLKHQIDAHNPFAVLQTFGGFEIAGLVGAYITAAQNKIPSVIDGFISTAAALIACQFNPSSRDWFLFSHQSAEPAHAKALDFFQAKPLLDLRMRLGEGSGAAVCLPLLKSALSLHNNMATFAEATVAGRN